MDTSKGFYSGLINNISMISKSILAQVIKDQKEEFNNLTGTVKRDEFKEVISYSGASALILKGLRRCGKSTLLKQLIDKKFRDNFFYFNFDEERIINFKTEDFQKLMETFMELYGDKKTIFFDEIQNITGWELFINRLLRQGYHIFITGSNSNLLSKELGTHLTGRHVDLELFPFSFAEYLRAKQIEPKNKYYSTKENALYSKYFKQYLKEGGMPEKVVFNNNSILTQVLTDITQKDIVNRYNLRKPAEFRAILNFLLSNTANTITYRSIKNNFNIKSITTIQKYIQYAEETYIIFQVHRFERKIKLINKNPKKIYCIDNGIVSHNTPSTKEQEGNLLENVIAVQLKRNGKEFYYYQKDNSEADFVVPKEKTVLQVCYNLNETNKEREFKGLKKAMEEMKTNKGTIITLDQENIIKEKGKTIEIIPAWKWLLEK